MTILINISKGRTLWLKLRLGINVIEAVAENLPFSDEEFDFVLMITAVCFFDNEVGEYPL